MPIYRVTVTADAELDSDRPLTAEQIELIDRQIIWQDDRVRLKSTSVEIVQPSCVDVAHRRNSIDGHFYACGMDEADAIHLPLAECEAFGPCVAPEQHHSYVSPGWDAPSDG